MLSIAKGLLETEVTDKIEEKRAYMSENCTPLSLPSGTQALQVPMANGDVVYWDRSILGIKSINTQFYTDVTGTDAQWFIRMSGSIAHW